MMVLLRRARAEGGERHRRRHGQLALELLWREVLPLLRLARRLMEWTSGAAGGALALALLHVLRRDGLEKSRGRRGIARQIVALDIAERPVEHVRPRPADDARRGVDVAR